MKLQLNCDGGARGNPGPAAYGYVIQDISSGAAIILEKCGNYLGETTNNQAEYRGLIDGLAWIVAHHPEAEVEIVMDSLLIVNQVKGLYKVKNPDLRLRHAEVGVLLARLKAYTIRHVLRHENALADELVNQVLDSQ